MKLSEMSPDKGADVYIQLVPLIGGIVADEKYVALWRKGRSAKKKGAQVSAFDPNEVIAYLLESHRESVWKILGLLNEKSVDEIRAQRFSDISKQMSEMFSDREVMDFFMPYRALVQETASATSQK